MLLIYTVVNKFLNDILPTNSLKVSLSLYMCRFCLSSQMIKQITIVDPRLTVLEKLNEIKI